MFAQAANRLPTEQAVLYALITGEWEGSAMRIVIALGGNALLRRGEPAEADAQRRNVATAVAAIAELAAEHEVIVTHGNGPQVGLLALQGDAYDAVAPYPLDVLGAESEGQIGYLLDQELRQRARRPRRWRRCSRR